MEQVTKLKRTWNLAPVLHIVQKIRENYCPCLHQSIGQVWWLKWVVVQKIYSKMHPVSCANTHHDVTDLANHEMLKNTKTWISWEWNITFLLNKQILNLYLRWHILRSYHFVDEISNDNPSLKDEINNLKETVIKYLQEENQKLQQKFNKLEGKIVKLEQVQNSYLW